jgi:hypothetical protein
LPKFSLVLIVVEVAQRSAEDALRRLANDLKTGKF